MARIRVCHTEAALTLTENNGRTRGTTDYNGHSKIILPASSAWRLLRRRSGHTSNCNPLLYTHYAPDCLLSSISSIVLPLPLPLGPALTAAIQQATVSECAVSFIVNPHVQSECASML